MVLSTPQDWRPIEPAKPPQILSSELWNTEAWFPDNWRLAADRTDMVPAIRQNLSERRPVLSRDLRAEAEADAEARKRTLAAWPEIEARGQARKADREARLDPDTLAALRRLRLENASAAAANAARPIEAPDPLRKAPKDLKHLHRKACEILAAYGIPPEASALWLRREDWLVPSAREGASYETHRVLFWVLPVWGEAPIGGEPYCDQPSDLHAWEPTPGAREALYSADGQPDQDGKGGHGGEGGGGLQTGENPRRRMKRWDLEHCDSLHLRNAIRFFAPPTRPEEARLPGLGDVSDPDGPLASALEVLEHVAFLQSRESADAAADQGHASLLTDPKWQALREGIAETKDPGLIAAFYALDRADLFSRSYKEGFNAGFAAGEMLGWRGRTQVVARWSDEKSADKVPRKEIQAALKAGGYSSISGLVRKLRAEATATSKDQRSALQLWILTVSEKHAWRPFAEEQTNMKSAQN